MLIEHSFGKRKQAIVFIVLVTLVVSLFTFRELRKPEPIPNYSSSDISTETTIVIPEGSTGDQIARLLFEADVVKSARAFFAAATSNKRSKFIQPGTYRLNTKLSGRDAVNQLLDSKRRIHVLLIKEGERAYEIASSLKGFGYSDEDVVKLIEPKIELSGFGKRKSEGFFFPATYNLTPSQNIQEIRTDLVTKFEKVLTSLDFINQSRSAGYDPYEMLIIASIIQAEGFDSRDFERISRVIFNRLDAGMPLQMDSTNLYALRERRIAVTSKDLAIASPYNTYDRKGLPPTPIGNPGRAALKAALHPIEGDWLYFVTVEPSITKFTKSYTEFLKFKAEFKRNLKEGRFGNNDEN